MTTTTRTRSRRARLSPEERQQRAQDALRRAQSGHSIANDAHVIAHFTARGMTDVRPRENVLTFHGWRALGRTVRKGEHGCRLSVFVTTEQRDPETGETKTTGRLARSTTVFHIDQTAELGAPA